MGKPVTPVFRGSFVWLNEPHAPPGSDNAKYSINVVLEKDNAEHMQFLKRLRKEIHELQVEKFGDPEVKKYKFKSPIKDGDDELIEQWENCWVFQASTDRQPGVVGPDKAPIIDPKEIYSGAWYRISYSLYAWDHPTGGKGISVSLSNVMKVRDDEAFDGRTSAESDFEDIEYEEEYEEEDVF